MVNCSLEKMFIIVTINGERIEIGMMFIDKVEGTAYRHS